MKKISQAIALTVFLAACNTASFKKGQEGMEYKIIGEGKNPVIKYGQYMQINYATFYNDGKKDTLLVDSRETSGPVIQVFDSVQTPKAYFEILRQVRKGDSLLIRIKTDSAFKNARPGEMPDFMKKGNYLITAVKVLNIFDNKTQADSARDAEAKNKEVRDSIKAIAQLAKDDKIIQDYLAKNNIKAQKAEKGTYVEIIKPGTGALIDTSVVAKVNYTGRTLSGEMFDSNTDPAKGHVEPLLLNMTSDMSLGNHMISGWYDGFKLLNKGAVARLYIPSSLAYGPDGRRPFIKPNEILVFDVEVLDILNKEQARVVAEAERAKKQAMQKRWLDSMKAAEAQKTNADKSLKPDVKQP
jgi:FKBP-type peptidyl-prolyl cis-trans isomerase